MKQVKGYMALLGVLLMLAPAGFGQARYDRGARPLDSGGYVDRATNRFKPQYVPPVDMSNTSRLDQLIRAGNLYLSLEDAIALALENNIGLESQRYQFQLSDVAYTSADAQWDPTFSMNQFNFSHSANIQTNAVTAGGQQVNTGNAYARGFQLAQPLKTGGSATFGFTSNKSTTNNKNDNFVPSLRGGLSLNFTQPLLSGFGVGLNTRQLVIARNNQRNADNAFKIQINSTVNQVVQAYWNLKSAALNVGVAQLSLDLANRLLDQNKKQIEIGTMAPVDINQTEVQVANGESSLIQAEASVRTQENTLKGLISRNGIANAQLASVHIITTSPLDVPDVEPVRPIQDLIESALSNRPELAQQRINMDNSRINLKAARNSLLPQLNLSANISNPAQGGQLNPLPNVDIRGNVVDRDVNPELIGGFSNILRQLFTIPTLTYGVGFTFTMNIRNRTAQAAYVTQELQLRQTELGLQQQINTIRTDVSNAQINIETARARYAAAVKALSAQEKTLDATDRRNQLGAATLFEVIQQQNTLASQRQSLVSAQVSYATAKLGLDVATGTLLDKYNIVYDEAKDGQLSRRPDPIQDVVNTPNQAANAARRP